jgi:uncharacterized membrane protein
MSLTYTPFESSPELGKMASDLGMNVGNKERALGGILGFGLLGAGTRFRGSAGWAMVALGAGLLVRSFTGRCPWYRYLEVDHRHATSGVPGNRGVEVTEAIQVNRSPEVLFDFWSDLERLAAIIPGIVSVRQQSEKRSRWAIRGPLGQTIEWDAETIRQDAPGLIAWRSLPGAAVSNAGSVRFEEADGGTLVKVSLEIDPPAGKAGAAVASMLGHAPQTKLAEALASFKRFAERELLPGRPIAPSS